ncbi:hypothetical protein Scep_001800 [Stephania cephalantha]|uniref:DDE Tnp4 domain-containing protein n=1 Tax=Stephania cephalantha TaxID=152367 RepID=A0AAP0LCJ5_9MAGN
MRHVKVRNIIETCFGALKQRWFVLRSPCYYNVSSEFYRKIPCIYASSPAEREVKMMTFIIHVCAILHNFVIKEVPNDLLDTIIPEGQELGANDDASNEQAKKISTV